MRDELVKRRIQQPYCDWKAVHGFENSDKVSPLKRQQFRERCFSRAGCVCQNHFLDRLLPLATSFRMFEILEEHMLRADQSDSLRAHFAGYSGVLRSVGISANSELANLIRPFQQRIEGLRRFWPY